MKREMCGALLGNGRAPAIRLCDNDTPCPEHGTEIGEGIGIEMPDKVCSTCGKSGGPYPDGNRPKPKGIQSGCPRCGWCY